jgi:hypothetical protein
MMRSGKITLSAADSYAALKLPKKAFVVGLWLEIITAYDDVAVEEIAGTITVGFSGNGESADADHFLTSAQAAPLVTGMKASSVAKWFDSASGLITVTPTANDSTVDPVVRLWVFYSTIC